MIALLIFQLFMGEITEKSRVEKTTGNFQGETG